MLSLLIALTISSLSIASPAKALEAAVADDIQALLSDTVNEGEQTAQVVRRSVDCKISPMRGSAVRQWAFCRMDFEVSYAGETSVRGCALLYSFAEGAANFSLQRGKDEQFQSCIEALSESL